MSINRTGLLSIVLVTTLSMREDSLTCDPALNLEADGAPELLSRYLATRSDEDRAALPLLPESTPVLFHLQPMNAAAIRFCKSAPEGEVRVQRYVLATCHEFTDETGRTHKASEHGKMHDSADKKFRIASDAWLDFLIGRFGNAALSEIAQVAADRSEAGPRALAPFVLPPGLTLPR